MKDEKIVVLGDVHFTPDTLELATVSLSRAMEYAKRLNLPVILNGDTLDTKAIIRAECANRLIALLDNKDNPRVIVNTGNHDLIAEKGKDSSLNFLRPYVEVIGLPTYDKALDIWIIPYQSNADTLAEVLKNIPTLSTVFVHQGVQGAKMGHYATDHSSLSPHLYARFRTIGSHYHQAQDIGCGPDRGNCVGTFSYCGSPYTMNFGEAHDGPKGFRVLTASGDLRMRQLDLRRHIIVERTYDTVMERIPSVRAIDKVWLKVSGPTAKLDTLDKDAIGQALLGHSNFKLDKIPTDAPQKEEIETLPKTFRENMLRLISNSPDEDALKGTFEDLTR